MLSACGAFFDRVTLCILYAVDHVFWSKVCVRSNGELACFGGSLSLLNAYDGDELFGESG